MADLAVALGNGASGSSLMEVLSQVPDPRSRHGLRHPLSALLGLTVVAILAGMRGPESIAQFGRDHGWPLLKLLGFRRKAGPCKATLSNLYRALDATEFETLLRRWILARCPELEGHVVLDGKTVTNATVVNTETMCELPRRIAALKLTGPITLVLDNAPARGMRS